MSDGVQFDAESAKRIARAVRRTERQPLGNPLDDGTSPPPLAASIDVEVECSGPAVACVVDYESGASSGSCGACSYTIYPAILLAWNKTAKCWDAAQNVWIFELNNGSLAEGERYRAKIIQHNFVPPGLAETECRLLGYVTLGGGSGGPTVDIVIVRKVCLIPPE